MTCDCFRLEKDKSRITENRVYSKGALVLSYIQLFGDLPVHGHILPNLLHNTSNISTEYIHPKWSYKFVDSILHVVHELQPKPTHYVVNICYHPHLKTIHDIPEAMLYL